MTIIAICRMCGGRSGEHGDLCEIKMYQDAIATLSAERDAEIAQGSHNLQIGEAQVRIMRERLDKAEAEGKRWRGLIEKAWSEAYQSAYNAAKCGPRHDTFECNEAWKRSDARRAMGN